MTDDQTDYKSVIHGHQVTSDDDDQESRRYLRGLDRDEAKTIFNQAKRHGNAEFEVRENGRRADYTAGYKNGRYTVEEKPKKSSGWF